MSISRLQLFLAVSQAQEKAVFMKLPGNDSPATSLDCDAFRQYHPYSEHLSQDAATYGEKTNPFVFEVVDRLVAELSDQGFNMIMESSMKSPHTAFANNELLSPKGYAIKACIMATPKDISWQGVVDRYNSQLEKKNETLRNSSAKRIHLL